MSVGFYGGKFLPLHLGHVNMIMRASTMVDKLYVVCSYSYARDFAMCNLSGCDDMPGDERLAWLGEIINSMDNVTVIGIEDDGDIDEEYDWEDGAKKIKLAIKEDIDFVFSSEHSYSEKFNELYPGTEHVVLDANRSKVDISGTEIRKDVYSNWNMLPKVVQKYFVKKIAIVGTESCGKSTLALKLAAMYNTNCVTEVGRDYCDRYSNQLTRSMFSSIAMDHYRKTETMMEDSNKMIFIDSEAIITEYYAEMYLNKIDPHSDEGYMYDYQSNYPIIEGIIDEQELDLVLYLIPDVKWVDDGQRFAGEQKIREENDTKLQNMFAEHGIDVIIISGSYEERMQKACAEIDKLMR